MKENEILINNTTDFIKLDNYFSRNKPSIYVVEKSLLENDSSLESFLSIKLYDKFGINQKLFLEFNFFEDIDIVKTILAENATNDEIYKYNTDNTIYNFAKSLQYSILDNYSETRAHSENCKIIFEKFNLKSRLIIMSFLLELIQNEELIKKFNIRIFYLDTILSYFQSRIEVVEQNINPINKNEVFSKKSKNQLMSYNWLGTPNQLKSFFNKFKRYLHSKTTYKQFNDCFSKTDKKSITPLTVIKFNQSDLIYLTDLLMCKNLIPKEAHRNWQKFTLVFKDYNGDDFEISSLKTLKSNLERDYSSNSKKKVENLFS